MTRRLFILLLHCSPHIFWVGGLSAQDTLRAGSPALAGAAPVLGTTSFESYRIHKGERTPVNRSTLTVTRHSEDGIPSFVVSIVHRAAGKTDSALTTVIVREKDLALLRHKVEAPLDSAVVMYTPGHLSGWVVLPNEPVKLIDSETPRPVFPVDGPVPWFLGVLPLREGFRAVLPRYSMWQDAESYEEVTVMGTDTLERNRTAVECWKVDNGPFAIPGYRAYRWVDKQSRKILQTVLRGKPDEPEYWTISN